MWPLTLALNVFIEAVYAEIITSLPSCEDVNVFIDAVYAAMIIFFCSNEPVLILRSVMCPLTLALNVFKLDVLSSNLLNLDEITPVPLPI